MLGFLLNNHPLQSSRHPYHNISFHQEQKVGQFDPLISHLQRGILYPSIYPSQWTLLQL
jgi:hypothetical protein